MTTATLVRIKLELGVKCAKRFFFQATQSTRYFQGINLLFHVLGTFNLCGESVIKKLFTFSHFFPFLAFFATACTYFLHQLNPKPSATAMSTATSTAKNDQKSSSRSLQLLLLLPEIRCSNSQSSSYRKQTQTQQQPKQQLL